MFVIQQRIIRYVLRIFRGHYDLSGPLCRNGGHYRCDQYQDDGAVEDIFIQDACPVTHQYHRQGGRCVSAAQAEDQVALRERIAKRQLGNQRCHPLARQGDHRKRNGYDDGHRPCKYHRQVHQHTHTDQEKGNEQRVADKLYPVHQGRGVRHQFVESQT